MIERDFDTITRLPSLPTVEEVSKALRMNRNTVYQLGGSGEIPGMIRVGRNVRFVKRILVQWLTQPRATPSRSKR